MDDLLDLVIQDQHESTAHASEHVRPGSLEESLATLITCDLPPAVRDVNFSYNRS